MEETDLSFINQEADGGYDGGYGDWEPEYPQFALSLVTHFAPTSPVKTQSKFEVLEDEENEESDVHMTSALLTPNSRSTSESLKGGLNALDTTHPPPDK